MESFLDAGVGFEPHDLRVMSPTSYQAALPCDIFRLQKALYHSFFDLSTPFLLFILFFYQLLLFYLNYISFFIVLFLFYDFYYIFLF